MDYFARRFRRVSTIPISRIQDESELGIGSADTNRDRADRRGIGLLTEEPCELGAKFPPLAHLGHIFMHLAHHGDTIPNGVGRDSRVTRVFVYRLHIRVSHLAKSEARSLHRRWRHDDINHAALSL